MAIDFMASPIIDSNWIVTRILRLAPVGYANYETAVNTRNEHDANYWIDAKILPQSSLNIGKQSEKLMSRSENLVI
jgi:hypothetical protein